MKLHIIGLVFVNLLLFSHPAFCADSTQLLLAKTIAGEAYGDGNKGMELVAMVVINRSKAYKKTIREAIVQRGAFYGLKSGLYDKLTMKQKAEVNKIALRALNGELVDVTSGALFFINPAHEKPFKWCKVMTYKYKNHVFYK